MNDRNAMKMGLLSFTICSFLLISEIMLNVKTTPKKYSIPAIEWVRRLAEETSVFEIIKVMDEMVAMTDRRRLHWDHIITLLVKPNQRRVKLFVEARYHLLPNTLLGLLQQFKGDRPSRRFDTGETGVIKRSPLTRFTHL